jgi:heme-degrading monooxygenase HmoA
MEDFERWTKSRAFEEAHADPPPREAFAGENVLEIHEVIASVEAADAQE